LLDSKFPPHLLKEEINSTRIRMEKALKEDERNETRGKRKKV